MVLEPAPDGRGAGRGATAEVCRRPGRRTRTGVLPLPHRGRRRHGRRHRDRGHARVLRHGQLIEIIGAVDAQQGASEHGGRTVNETRRTKWALPHLGRAQQDAVGRARGWARLALVLVAGCVAVVMAGAGSGGWLVLLAGFALLALAGAGVWWMLAHRGGLRMLGGLLAVTAPVGVMVLYALSGLWPVAVGALGLWAGAL